MQGPCIQGGQGPQRKNSVLIAPLDSFMVPSYGKNNESANKYAQTLILVNLIVVKIIGFGHNSESSGAFLTKIGGNDSYRPPGPF